ncbi:MAG TPA: tetratricopeptide repeat protein [Planktothrix sp.]|jgi:tetratricopeptide (TPR) repeat protein
MRIIRPSALLVAGTVALFGATVAFAETSTEPAAKDAAAPQTTTAPADAQADASKKAEAPAGSEAPKRHRGFSFNVNDSNKPLDPEDSQEKIDKARPLHDQAVELFNKGQADQAFALEKQAIEAAPNYWLPHAGLAYMLQKTRHSPFEALREATESVRTRHPAVADSNTARLFESIHMFQPAVVEYRKAMKAEPDAWLNDLGLADCYIIQGQQDEAKKALAELSPAALSQFDCLAATSTRYLAIPDYSKAKELLTKAVELAPNAQDKQDATDLLYSAAFKSDDNELLSKLQPQVSKELTQQSPAQVFGGKARLASIPTDIDFILSDVAAVQSPAPEDTFYAVGLECLKKADTDSANKAQWLAKANQAFRNASIRNSAMKYQLAVIAVADERKDFDGLTQALQSLKDSVPTDTPTLLKLGEMDPKDIPALVAAYQKRNLLEAYALRKDPQNGDLYDTTAKTLRIKLLKPSCTCHARAIGTAMGQEPGAIFSWVSSDQNPIVTVVYDSKKVNSAKLLNSQVMQNLKEPYEEQPVQAVNTFAQLDNLLVANDLAKPVRASAPKIVLDLPTEHNGQVAETNTTPATVH